MGRGGATVFRQWGQDFLCISFTACSPNFSGDNNIVLPPQPHLSGVRLPPLPYGGAAHALGALEEKDTKCLKEPKTTDATMAIAEKQFKRSKKGPFCDILRPTGSSPVSRKWK